MREAFGNALLELGEEYENLVVLDADVAKSTHTDIFKKIFRKRFFNMGVAEQDMVSTAAGMAAAGLIPVISTFAIFAVGRAFEQLRNSICYPGLNVKIIGTHAGITVGEDGASHHTIEDIAITRVLPNLSIVVPSDPIELTYLLKKAIKLKGPVYFRIPRISLPVVHTNDYKSDIGKIETIKDGEELTIISTGVMLHRSIEAAKALEDEGVSTAILNVHTIKPLDKDSLIRFAKKTKKILVVEEHSVMGGVGSAVAEILVQHYPVKMKLLGLNDTFAQSGNAFVLLDNYGLSIENIIKKGLELAQGL